MCETSHFCDQGSGTMALQNALSSHNANLLKSWLQIYKLFSLFSLRDLARFEEILHHRLYKNRTLCKLLYSIFGCYSWSFVPV
jgi:hypothetical protein